MREFSDISRRLKNIVRLGKVYEVDYTAAKARIKCGEILTDWLPFATNRAAATSCWNPPKVGEQVVVLSPEGDLSQGVVLSSIYQKRFSAPSKEKEVTMIKFSDGSKIEYDSSSHKLKIDTKKLELVGEGGELLSLLSDALDIIANSKTPTLMGSQLSIENSTKLPLIKEKIDKFRS